jgi:hypothetical protein
MATSRTIGGGGGGGSSCLCLKYLYGWCEYLIIGEWLGVRAAAGGLVEQVAEHVEQEKYW